MKSSIAKRNCKWALNVNVIENEVIHEHSFVRLTEGERVKVQSEQGTAQFILVAGRPIGEPIVQYGPFVMNSQQEIHQAMADYRDGTLVRHKAELNQTVETA